MKLFSVKFEGYIEATNEEEAYDNFLDYLAECVRYGDVTCFEFEEHQPKNNTTTVTQEITQ